MEWISEFHGYQAMSRRVTFKLSGEKLNVALKFANDLGMDLNRVAERALYFTIKQAYETRPIGPDPSDTSSPEEPYVSRYGEVDSNGEAHVTAQADVTGAVPAEPPTTDRGDAVAGTPDLADRGQG